MPTATAIGASTAGALVGVPLTTVGAVAASATAVAAASGGGDSSSADVTAPSTTVSAISISHDTGSSATDFLTRSADQTIGATLSAALASGERLWASLDGGTTWVDVTASVSGRTLRWEGATLEPGGEIRMEVRNTAGSGPAASQAYTLDQTTAAPGVALSEDSGASGTDRVSAVGTLAITGVEAGGVVSYSIDGGTTWTSTFTAAEGVNNVKVRVTDAAGNTAVTDFSFTRDTVAPTATLTPVVEEAPRGVTGVEQASDGGAPVLLSLPSGVAAGFVITLTVQGPSGPATTVDYTVTAGDVTAGQARIVIPTGQMPEEGSYGVTATLTDLAGNVGSPGASTAFQVLPGLYPDSDCVVLGFERVLYEAADPLAEDAPTSNVFIVSDGLDPATVDELAIFEHEYVLNTGADLANTDPTLTVGAGGLAIEASGAVGGRTFVVGASAQADTVSSGGLPLAGDAGEFVWVDRLELSVDSTADARGEVYLVAHADTGGTDARAGAFDVGVQAVGVTTADAQGAVFARALTDGNAAVEACHLSLEASAGSGDAAAKLLRVATELGEAGYSEGHYAGLASYADASATATVDIHEDVSLRADSQSGSEASAVLGALLAVANEDGLASIDVGGSISAEASADSGSADAGIDELALSADGSDAQAAFEIGGDVRVEAVAAVDASAYVGQLELESDGMGAGSTLTIGGSVLAEARSSANAEAELDSWDITASGNAAKAEVTIGGSYRAEAVGQSSATAEIASGSISASSTATIARLDIGGDLVSRAESALGQATAEGGSWEIAAGGEDSLAELRVGGDILFEAVGDAAAISVSCTWEIGADGDGAIARLDIGGDLALNAVATNGDAEISMSDMSINAGGEDALSEVVIGGDLTSTATSVGGDAEVDMNQWDIQAEVAGAIARMDVAGGVIYTATTTEGGAAVDVDAIGLLAAGNFANASFSARELRYEATGAEYVEVYVDSIEAEATATNAAANVTIAQGMTLTAQQDSVAGDNDSIVEFDGFLAQASNGGTAVVQVAGGVQASVQGEDATLSMGFNRAVGAQASLDFGPSVSMNLHGGNNVKLEGTFAAYGGHVEMGAVQLGLTSDTTEIDGDDDMTVAFGAWNGGQLAIESLAVSLDAEDGDGRVYIGNDHASATSAGTVTLGDVSLTAGFESALYLNLGSAVDFDATRELTVTGNAVSTVDLQVDGGVFGSIDLSAMEGRFTYAQQVLGTDEDLTSHSFGDLDVSVLRGFDVADDMLTFGNLAVDTGNGNAAPLVTGQADGVLTPGEIGATASVATEAALWSALDALLDGSVDVAYAKWTGATIDLGDGRSITNDGSGDWFAVAYDDDGVGMTTLTWVQVDEGASLSSSNFA